MAPKKRVEKGGQSKRPGKSKRIISSTAATLWFGDIPQELASVKRVGEILYSSKPRTMPTPHVKHVVKKGYRMGSSRDRSAALAACEHEQEQQVQEDHEREDITTFGGVQEEGDGSMAGKARRRKHGAWLGYAFVVFRDEEEAAEARAAFDGVELAKGWKPRVLPAEDRRKANGGGVGGGGRLGCGTVGLGGRIAAPGEDPSLGHQLFPQTLRPQERAAAVMRHRAAAG